MGAFCFTTALAEMKSAGTSWSEVLRPMDKGEGADGTKTEFWENSRLTSKIKAVLGRILHRDPSMGCFRQDQPSLPASITCFFGAGSWCLYVAQAENTA